MRIAESPERDGAEYRDGEIMKDWLWVRVAGVSGDCQGAHEQLRIFFRVRWKKC